MNEQPLQRLLSQGLVLDGATGTQLQAAGMPTGICPEIWVLEHPDILAGIQQAYLDAGSDILYAFTFGASRIKLAHHGIPSSETQSVNRQLAALSIAIRDQWQSGPDARGRRAFVAGDLAPTGLFLKPAGDLTFDDLVDIYREQVRGQLEAGVDLFVAETMMDLAQTRAAVLAVQSECDLPVLASMTFEPNGRTLSGDTPMASMLTLAGLGAAAFGLNCSFGPERLADLIMPLAAVSPVPLLVKPNAGLPVIIDGKTVFPMQPPAFAQAMQPMLDAGVRLPGGCCGTTPEHIRLLALAMHASGSRMFQAPAEPGQWICSSRECHQIQTSTRFGLVTCHEASDLVDVSLDVLDDEPDVLVIQAGADAGSVESWQMALLDLQLMTSVPLVFQIESTEVLTALLRIYPGRAGILAHPSGPDYGACLVSKQW